MTNYASGDDDNDNDDDSDDDTPGPSIVAQFHLNNSRDGIYKFHRC